MQYDLDFIKTGAIYPPKSEATRIKEYKDNLNLYRGNFEEVFSWYKSRLCKFDGKRYEDTFYVLLNYCRLLSVKTADLVCGEEPDITINDEIAKDEQKRIRESASIVNKSLRPAIIDYSRVGETVLRPYLAIDGNVRVVVVNPTMVVPVVSKEDNTFIQAYVLAYASDKEIIVQIHERGKYTERRYKTDKTESTTHNIDGQTISIKSYQLGVLLNNEKEVRTGLDGFAIFHIANEPTSDNIHGTSDYSSISTIVAEMQVRFAQIARILDKNADPSIAASPENFDYDDDGKITHYKGGGRAYTIGQDGSIPQYITWDGQLQAAYLQLDKLSNELDKLSEMGAVISDNSESAGGSQGYEAMQVRMTNARLKARRISEALDGRYKDLIKAVYQLKYNKPLTTEFTVAWNDGLPNDAKRDAEIAQIEANAGFKSKKTIRKEYYGMTETRAQEEEDQINEERASPTIESVFAGDLQ